MSLASSSAQGVGGGEASGPYMPPPPMPPPCMGEGGGLPMPPPDLPPPSMPPPTPGAGGAGGSRGGLLGGVVTTVGAETIGMPSAALAAAAVRRLEERAAFTPDALCDAGTAIVAVMITLAALSEMLTWLASG